MALPDHKDPLDSLDQLDHQDKMDNPELLEALDFQETMPPTAHAHHVQQYSCRDSLTKSTMLLLSLRLAYGSYRVR
ncbi:unnamed protein product [Strongylus vulgaris]|uniref:Uncharacterized protein n=1 Tax=Strongylus vulgaris TaxID=40348 RepID=A0A3P7J645_STRVU|nr:unnamed protein product [Strongylus vulgaris]